MIPLREDSREEGLCPICQEGLKEAVSTDCGHLFCRVCLAQHLGKASASGVLSCPLCRKPCSEGVLGAGYTCHSHQKKVCWFCEESRLLLCVECRGSPEHSSHCELAIENAISHYKVRRGHCSYPPGTTSLSYPHPPPVSCLASHRGSVTDTWSLLPRLILDSCLCFSVRILLLMFKFQCIEMSLRGDAVTVMSGSQES